ncbi:hypothetical protein Q2K19_22075 [Micromonospora soli]|uniref:hypothetical protein n=1 Tax=Micromonospora sp. NBRC 110009 TaxID=3061627 RepID=UPI00267311E3|nr:hypothetical protein [Micromonospora sp. NBRC 110009]WKT96864.1 hypothetical protein Q2K19_22075 [Micromonospora sp. NBRC 110009]
MTTDTTADSGISRLNAFDGLFLRAEHLVRIQDYARDLVLASGTAGGPGVIEGFRVTPGKTQEPGKQPENWLDISPGLAVDPAGRPLRSREDIRLPLTDEFMPTLADNGFWFIEIYAGTWQYGYADVSGSLCDEPCAGGTSRLLYQGEGVRAQLSAAALPEFDGQQPERRRNWLARRQFAAEETDGERDLLATGNAPLVKEMWLPPVPAPSSGTQPVVRIGVLIPGRSKMSDEVDTWIARRDRGAAPPERAWRWRLGMRPWDVYVAQILQFQDQLADRYPQPSQPAQRQVRLDYADLIREAAAKAVGRAQTKVMTRQLLAQLADDLTAAVQSVSGPAGKLFDLGFADLPPAGFLPYPNGSPAGVTTWLAEMLPATLSITACTCRPSDVAQAIEEAQHRDRIPLTASGGAKTEVRVLIPVDDQGRVPSGWVAFVRPDRTVCPTPEERLDEVTAFEVNFLDQQTYEADLKSLESGDLPDRYAKAPEDQVRTISLRYPLRGWRLPDDAGLGGNYGRLRQRLRESKDLRIFVLARAESELPVGVLRATLLVDPLALAPWLGKIEPVEGRNVARQSIVLLFGPEKLGIVAKP